MAKYLVHRYQQNIHGRLHFAYHNTFKITKIEIKHFTIWRNQHNVHGRFFTISTNQ
jgi:hypothetical protein